MNEPIDVLLSVTKLRPDERLLLDTLRARGLRAATALPADIGDVLNGSTPAPSAAVIRNLSHHEAAGIAHRLELAGVTTVNRGPAIDLCQDKGKQALLFARHGIPHPRSFHAFNHNQVGDLTRQIGWPVVVKPLSSSWGRGVVRLSNEDCLAAWTGGCESTDVAGKMFPVLVQEHVDKPDHDLRVVVVGTEPVVAIMRKSTDWRTNTHLGAVVERVEITSRIAQLCAQVVEVLGAGFYGIDLIEDGGSGELKVLEVNANPEFARSSAEHKVDIAAHLATYLLEQVLTSVAVP